MRRPGALLLSLLLGLASVQGLFFSPTQCNLNCKRGRCQKIVGDDAAHAFAVQSGKLILECICEPGFAGLGCDLPVPACSSSSSSGCNSRVLACAAADATSRFASLMCRKPYTEYCTEKYNPNIELPFCTNGGKCRGGLIAAHISPGNTTVNKQYENLGCSCPPEFYGPHCEFLRHGAAATADGPRTSAEEEDEKRKISWRYPTPEEAMMGLAVLVALLAVAICMHFRSRRQRHLTGSSLVPAPDCRSESNAGGTVASNETPFLARQRRNRNDDSSVLTGLYRDEYDDDVQDNLLLREVSVSRIDLGSNGRDSPTRFFLD